MGRGKSHQEKVGGLRQHVFSLVFVSEKYHIIVLMLFWFETCYIDVPAECEWR
jgi:hypothetical protein